MARAATKTEAVSHPATPGGRRRRRGAAALAIAASVLFAAGPVLAAASPPPPIKPRPLPMQCVLAAATFGPSNLWFGRYAGNRETIWGYTQTTSQWGCFLREIDCRNWLYWLNSDWPDWTYISVCTKGYTPS